MLAAKRLWPIVELWVAARCGLAMLAFFLLVAAADQAHAGLIVSAEGAPGMSATTSQDDSSPLTRAGSAEDQPSDFSDDLALPTGAGSPPSNASTTAGISAILPEVCGCSTSAFSAALCEERALHLPPSPFFDHLRPPQA